MLLTDTQINSVAKAYINDENFGSFGSELNMWKFYNLLTGANKSSYIDSFLDRSLNATEMALEKGILNECPFLKYQIINHVNLQVRK